jgi:hypothetical protein
VRTGLADEPDDGRLGILIDVDCRDDPDSEVRAADTWLNMVLDRIGLDAREELSGFRAAPGASITNKSNPWGAPGGRAAVLGSDHWRKGRIEGPDSWYSDAVFRRLATRLGKGDFSVYLYLEALDHDGRARDGFFTTQGDESSLCASAEVNEDAPGWLRLVSGVRLGALRRSPELQHRWLGVLADMSDQYNVSFAYVGVVGTHNRTAWECATMFGQGFTWPNTAQGLSWLRGYGWLTLVPPALTAELASTDPHLAVVHTSPRGARILQACPDALAFDRAAADLVRRTVAPILVPGQADQRQLEFNLGQEQHGLSGTWALGDE